MPSQAQVRDLNLHLSEMGKYTLNDFHSSLHLPEILQIVGSANRRDALHIDSAFKSGCRVFVTRDTDILVHSQHLERLLFIRFFHPDEDREALLQFIHSENGAA